MDSKLIYDPNKLSCSKPLHIGKTVEHFYKSLLDAPDNTEEDNKYHSLNQNIIGSLKKHKKYVSTEQFSSVQERCNIDLLKSPSDQKVLNLPTYKARKLYAYQDPLPDADLKTLHKLREFEFKMKQSATNIKLTMERILKYRSNIMIEPETHICLDSPMSHENVSLVTIRVYHPYKHEVGKVNLKGNPKFDREFKLLGSTLLKQFRDAFTCRQDLDTGEEKSCEPAKQTVPEDLGMGFFYINGILYLDDRYVYEETHEYAKSLQKWGTFKKMDIRIFDMDNIRFEDIYVRLGYPNVYQHRGCCEHVFIFSDIECLPKESALVTDNYNYPMISFIHADCQPYCAICSRYVATWVTINNKRTVTNESLWCQTCFIRYNYTENFEKIGEFEAYKFYA